MIPKSTTGYNDEVVKRLTKDQLIAQFADNPHVSAEDAGAYWDDIHKDDAKPDASVKSKVTPGSDGVAQ